jgi:hypothetical protein
MNNNPQITLVEQTSLEVADVKRAERVFRDELDAAMEDGVITPEEATRLYRRIDKLEEEIEEAVLVGREAAYTQKENDFRMKRGTHATPHYYLLREKREIQAMGGLKDYPATKAKAPQVVRGQVRLVSNR